MSLRLIDIDLMTTAYIFDQSNLKQSHECRSMIGIVDGIPLNSAMKYIQL